ncbi:hypothetical protein IWX50DRAFT_402323 [Phyllosticta citricarpa]
MQMWHRVCAGPVFAARHCTEEEMQRRGRGGGDGEQKGWMVLLLALTARVRRARQAQTAVVFVGSPGQLWASMPGQSRRGHYHWLLLARSAICHVWSVQLRPLPWARSIARAQQDCLRSSGCSIVRLPPFFASLQSGRLAARRFLCRATVQCDSFSCSSLFKKKKKKKIMLRGGLGVSPLPSSAPAQGWPRAAPPSPPSSSPTASMLSRIIVLVDRLGTFYSLALWSLTCATQMVNQRTYLATPR